MPADELVEVGRVGKAHGLAGAFVVEDASEDPARFAVGATLLADGEEVRVEESKRAGNRLVVRLDRRVGRGTSLTVPRSALPAPDPDTFYVFQLVGLEVVEDGGRALGRVRDVTAYEANDVLELDSGLLLPMVGECVREIDLGRGLILVARGFADAE